MLKFTNDLSLKSAYVPLPVVKIISNKPFLNDFYISYMSKVIIPLCSIAIAPGFSLLKSSFASPSVKSSNSITTSSSQSHHSKTGSQVLTNIPH